MESPSAEEYAYLSHLCGADEDEDNFESILSEINPEDPPVETNRSTPRKPRNLDEDVYSAGIYPWNCWQCDRLFCSECGLSSHISQCDVNPQPVSGCPFCPKDSQSSVKTPFHVKSFNQHMRTCHPMVFTLRCCYCATYMASTRLEELTKHMLCAHRIPWRPTPGG